MPLDPSTLSNPAAIVSIPLLPGLRGLEAQNQARHLLQIGLQASDLIAKSVKTEPKETTVEGGKRIDTAIFIAPREDHNEATSSLLDRLKTMETPATEFVRSLYSSCLGTLTYLAFIGQQTGKRYSLARVHEEFERDGFQYRAVYCDFAYYQLTGKVVSQSIAAFLGMYLDPVLPGSLNVFTKPLAPEVTPEILDKNIWHHPEQLGFGAVLALQVYLKPEAYATLMRERGFIRPEVTVTPEAITIGSQYLDGLRNQANPIIDPK